MIDPTKKSYRPDLTDQDRDKLINRIDELENLLAKKKEKTQQQDNSKFKVGTDGIPVLMETLFDESIDENISNSTENIQQDSRIVDEIISKVEDEISQDLDELIVMLKDSIIDDVKSRILSELKERKKSGPK